jgi:GxxExxY protein
LYVHTESGSRKVRKDRTDAKSAKKNKTKHTTGNEIFHKVIGVAIDVHKSLGPGLLESAYQAIFASELAAAGLKVEQQIAMPMIYKEIKLDCGYRVDLRINGKVLIALKSIEALAPTFFTNTYLFTFKRLQAGLAYQLQHCKDQGRNTPGSK